MAIFAALFIPLALYMVVSAAAISTLDMEALDNSTAPLVDIVEKEGRSGLFLTAVSLLIIVNGALAQIVMASRVIHDLGVRRGGAPAWLSEVNDKTDTPVLATLLSGAVVTVLALFLPTEQLAGITSYIILVVFFAANAALLAVKRRGTEAGSGVRTYPAIIPILGMIACAGLFGAQLLLGGGGE
jgi:amino acid transporter